VQRETTPEAARAIIDANAYLTLATADGAGAPWASPVWFAHEGHASFVWASRPDARHSRNLAARPEVGIVVFDSTVPMGGAHAVYVEGTAQEVDDADVEHLIAVFSSRSIAWGGPPWTAEDVTGGAPHRLYVARARTHFVLAERDQRHAVTLH
jgi:nitroimidazol reductase NimA-like FMN-containing flavoprotein (pyridoxamine 5'-phosphate oxidase superfamily)